ncbi:MAG: HAD family phosphatase [Chloroflexi bacterium]|nr:HAD family phosphatase [Chloroflexota bacterium]
MIKAIIFDVGGVLVRTANRSRRNALEQRLGLQPGESEIIVFNGEMGLKAQQGAITTLELWQWIQQHLRLTDEEFLAFRQDFWGGDQLDTTLIDLIRRLKRRYQTAIISNAADNLNQTLTVDYPMADAFDLIVGSAYEKIMKPDRIIFERTLARLGRQPEEAIFIDDFAHNIEGARAVGLHTIHFTPQTDLPAALAALGVELED